MIYSYSANTGVVYPSDYKDYKEKMDFINYNMLFTAQEKPLVTGIIGFNWSLVLTLLAALLLSSILIWHLYHKPYQTSYGFNFNPNYSSIGGWLVLLGIGVTLNPLLLLYAVYSEYSTEMNVNYLVYFFDPESSYFNPIKGYYAYFIAAANTCLFVFVADLKIAVFRRNSSACSLLKTKGDW